MHGHLELLDVFRRELRPVDGKRQLIECAGKPERHLIVPVVHRCTGIGAHVEVFVPLPFEMFFYRYLIYMVLSPLLVLVIIVTFLPIF
jgi:hypothetical protein